MSHTTRSGGSESWATYKQPHNMPIGKDATIAALIPPVVSECALHVDRKQSGHCISNEAISAVGAALHLSGNSENVMVQAKTKLACETERCVLEKLAPTLGATAVKREIDAHLKLRGPTDNTLLSNVHIDGVLRQWRERFPEFFPYNFNMRNYASYAYENGYVLNRPDTLATISFADLYTGALDGRKYKCCACVINSDTYQGDGKHWMALFADARGGAWTVEFFNSSGNAPAPEWVNWLEKTKNIMEDLGGKHTTCIMKVTAIRHQQSKSECGVYSLFYIWARLNGIRPDYFTQNPIPDQLMFEFRQHLFNDPSRTTLKKFYWNEYTNTVNIEWER